MKIIAAALLALMFIACSNDPEVIYVDENGTRIQTHETFKQEVVCNELGMAYYKNNNGYGNVYTPVLVSYFEENNPTSERNSPFITCKDYDKMMGVRK